MVLSKGFSRIVTVVAIAVATSPRLVVLVQGFSSVRLSSSSSSSYARRKSAFVSILKSTALGSATELPDSLEDAAERAAQATYDFVQQFGPCVRCRVDFDTSVGDETYAILKSSTEFMQKYTTACCLALIPGLQKMLQDEMTRVIQAKAELRQLAQEESKSDDEMNSNLRVQELMQIIQNKGRELPFKWTGPRCRIYFPDEGSAALARRDWQNVEKPLVPPCVELSSCSGVQLQDISQDMLVFFFCPKASESDFVEKILQKSEESCVNLKMTCFVNPNLVDMGVTGFGMAGRLLRERLIDRLTCVYYLRTLPWGALTRLWPLQYSVWQEDVSQVGGYKLIQTLGRLPSNPEVEDIYDIANGNMAAKQSGGILDQFGDFVQGMMRL